MLFVLDNYDSFTYNLVQYFGELGAEPTVRRNDEISVGGTRRAQARAHLHLARARASRSDAGISEDIIRELGPRIPVLGVCLGHQAIGEVFGGEVVRAGRLMHGKTSPILHDDDGVFAGLPSPFEATRYHSLVVRPESVPACLVPNARTAEGEIMGLRHREFPIHGVQFHPESILTLEGKRLLENFLRL